MTYYNRYYWTSSKIRQAIFEAKNKGLDYIVQKYGSARVNQIRQHVEKHVQNVRSGGERGGYNIRSSWNSGGKKVSVRGLATKRVIGSSKNNAPPKSDPSKYKTQAGTAVGGRFRDGGPGPTPPTPPPGSGDNFPGGNFKPLMKLNLENDSEKAQGQHHEWAQATSISSTITGLLRQAQNASGDYWDTWAQDKGGQYAIDGREGGQFGTELRWAPSPSGSGSGASSASSSFGSFGAYAAMQAGISAPHAGPENHVVIPGSDPKDYFLWHPGTGKFYGGNDPNRPTDGYGNYTGDFTMNGKTYTIGADGKVTEKVGNTPPTNTPPTNTPPAPDRDDIDPNIPKTPDKPMPTIPEVLGYDPNTPQGYYNPWGRLGGGEANHYGPSGETMAQATLEAMALANAYFAPQRMELAYELGDMETDMRRLATNLGRQVDDPVLQAKLFKEAQRAVRTVDVQQNTFAFQMAEQRRREEMSNFQFYDQLAQEEARLKFQNLHFYEQLDLQRRYYGLQREQVIQSILNPPNPTGGNIGTGGQQAGQNFAYQNGQYSSAVGMSKLAYGSAPPPPPVNSTLASLYSSLVPAGGTSGGAGNVTRSSWNY